MATLIVPHLDAEPWPTLGPDVCDFIEATWVYGPGPLKGQPYVIEPEFRAWLYRAYEVFPQSHSRSGWRRFKRCAMSLRKGTAKTEKGAIVTATESHPEAPIRFAGWDSSGNPVGRPVADPYIPMLAFSKDQTEDLGYAVLQVIIGESGEADRYDIGEERTLLLDNRGRKSGEIKPMAGSPSARDGALTSFQDFDETHRLILPNHVKAHNTMLQNAFKRRDADAWSMEHTTSPEPGEGSVAESTMEYAELIDQGKAKDPRLFFFHRNGIHPRKPEMETREEVRDYLLEASGPAAEWSGDIEGLIDHYFEPKTDRTYFRRVWGNEKVSGGGKAFDLKLWDQLQRSPLEGSKPNEYVPRRSLVVAGFDGARNRDATALIATHVDSCLQWPVGIWERPDHAPDEWEINQSEVTAALEDLFERYDVWRVYCDPHHWGPLIDIWQGRWGDDRIVPYDTTKWSRIGYAVRNYVELMRTMVLGHNGDRLFRSHIGNAYKAKLKLTDEDTGEPLYTLQKERPGSLLKIDAAMAGVLSAEAYSDAIAAGATVKKKRATPGRIR